jgi:preprotein translocase subunit SecE
MNPAPYHCTSPGSIVSSFILMSNPGVETIGSTRDRVKVTLAVLAFVAGIVGFYVLGDQPVIARVGSILVGIIAALAIGWYSEPGRRFIGFAQESYNEVKRVVWPTRKETIQMTATVFAFVTVMSIFLWVADKLIEWALYGVLLGWK